MRGSAALMKRSRNSYMRSPRKVTFAPIACPFRHLKLEILFLGCFLLFFFLLRFLRSLFFLSLLLALDQFHIRDMNGAFPFGDFPARIILGFSKVFLDDPHAFDDNTLFSRKHRQNLP